MNLASAVALKSNDVFPGLDRSPVTTQRRVNAGTAGSCLQEGDHPAHQGLPARGASPVASGDLSEPSSPHRDARVLLKPASPA